MIWLGLIEFKYHKTICLFSDIIISHILEKMNNYKKILVFIKIIYNLLTVYQISLNSDTYYFDSFILKQELTGDILSGGFIKKYSDS